MCGWAGPLPPIRHRGGAMRNAEEVTRLLVELEGADHETALARLLPLVYDQLRGLSEALLREERPDHTLQATALVHEAYLRLAGGRTVEWEDRRHFFRLAAMVMRRILVSHARAQKARKRGGNKGGLSLEEATLALPERDFTFLELDRALERLAEQDQQKARVVELRFFGGCTVKDAAETLGVSSATVERDWRLARAWLYRELESSQRD